MKRELNVLPILLPLSYHSVDRLRKVDGGCQAISYRLFHKEAHFVLQFNRDYRPIWRILFDDVLIIVR